MSAQADIEETGRKGAVEKTKRTEETGSIGDIDPSEREEEGMTITSKRGDIVRCTKQQYRGRRDI
jgi:hypothetical protein